MGMLRSSRLNFGRIVLVSPMVATRTVVAISAEVTPRSAARRVGTDGDLRTAQSGCRGRVADAGDRAHLALDRFSRAFKLGRAVGDQNELERLAGLAAAEAHAQPRNGGELGSDPALELALRELALAFRHELDRQRAGAHFAGARRADRVELRASADRGEDAGDFRMLSDDLARPLRGGDRPRVVCRAPFRY